MVRQGVQLCYYFPEFDLFEFVEGARQTLFERSTSGSCMLGSIFTESIRLVELYLKVHVPPRCQIWTGSFLVPVLPFDCQTLTKTGKTIMSLFLSVIYAPFEGF